MKKSTLEMMKNYLNGDDTVDLSTLRDEVNAEWERTTEKSRANADLYATAHDALMSADGWDKPMTVADLTEKFASVLPDGFTKSKMQYAFRALWSDEVEKHENGKSAYTYSRK